MYFLHKQGVSNSILLHSSKFGVQSIKSN